MVLAFASVLRLSAFSIATYLLILNIWQQKLCSTTIPNRDPLPSCACKKLEKKKEEFLFHCLASWHCLTFLTLKRGTLMEEKKRGVELYCNSGGFLSFSVESSSTDFMQLKIKHFWCSSKILKISQKLDSKDFRVTVLLLNIKSRTVLPSLMLYKTREWKKSLWCNCFAAMNQENIYCLLSVHSRVNVA